MSKVRATAVSWPNKPMPDRSKVLEIEGTYSRDEYVTISQGFVPQSANDKWFIYLEGEWLSFHRSASGTCIFMLKLVAEKNHYVAETLLVNNDPKQFNSQNDEYNLMLVSYLIDNLLLGRFTPFPQMQSLSRDDQQRHQEHVMGEETGKIQLRVVNGRSPKPPDPRPPAPNP